MMRITREEYAGFQENWDEQTRRRLDERMEVRYRRDQLEHLTPAEAATLRAMLDRMILQDEEIDLVGFIDWAWERPFGRGDRQEGMPAEGELFRIGLSGVEETARLMFQQSFPELQAGEQEQVLTAIQEGKAKGKAWKQIPPDQFFNKLLQKALTGYCAHPLVWMRMGFPGPSYPEGYVWVGLEQVLARRRHVPGWKTL